MAAAAAAAAEQEAATARNRLAQANAVTSALSQQLADAQIRLATRHHLDRLVDQRPSELQQDADYARKLLDRANQLRQELDARTRNRVVANAVVNAIDQQVLITNHLAAAAATTTASRQSDNQEITADLLKRKDDLSFRLLTVRKDLRSTTLERTKLRRRLHALNRDNATSVAFLTKRTEPPLLTSATAEELVAQLSPALQAYHASLNDALVVTSAKLVAVNHIFQKLVGELALPLHTYYLEPSSSPSSAANRPGPPSPSARAHSSAKETPSPSRSPTSHPTGTRIPKVGTEANLQDVDEMMEEQQQKGDSDINQGHQQRGREEEQEEGVLLTPSKLLQLVLLAGRHVDEEFDRSTGDNDDHNSSDDDEEEEENDKNDDGDFELLHGDWPEDEEDREEVKAEMAEWERIRTERDPWLVAKRKERERGRGAV